MAKGKLMQRRMAPFSIEPSNAVLIDDLAGLEESRCDTFQSRVLDLGNQD